jgi:hypothetical protein
MARVTNVIREKDKGAKKAIRSSAGLGKLSLTVGIVGEKVEEEKGTLTIGEIASFHEFGEGNNPERSFIRAWFDANRSAIETDVRNISRRVARGDIAERAALDILGAKFSGQIKKWISDGIAPPLLDTTVARKLAKGTGGSTPLIATGQTRASVSWAIE